MGVHELVRICRRWILPALTSLTATGVAVAGLDSTAWKAYEAVEEAWLHERHGMLVQQAPAALNAARLDLEIRLAELHRKALQFRHIQKCDPTLVGGAVWRLITLSLSSDESSHLEITPEYKKLEEKIQRLDASLTRHAQYSILKRAQSRLWKTPQYRNAHRRYTGRLQDLQAQYGSPSPASASTVN
jgi:hypothetical protein